MRSKLSICFLAAALAACTTGRAYQNPAYACLRHINLSLVYHGGNGLVRMATEVRYAVEFALAENQIALAGGPPDDEAPEFVLDLVDRGILPGASRSVMNLPALEPYRGTVPEVRVDVMDGLMGSSEGGDARIVDGIVYMRRASDQDPVFVGRVRGVIGYDFASPARMAESIAMLIRQGLSS